MKCAETWKIWVLALCIGGVVNNALLKDIRNKQNTPANVVEEGGKSKWTISRGIIAKPTSVPTPMPSIEKLQSDSDFSLVSNSLANDNAFTDEISSDMEEEVDDTLIFVITVDGRYHMISKNALEWSSEKSDPTVYSYDNMLGNPAKDNEYKRVIPDTDGMLLLYTEDGMRKTNMKASALADSAPFISDDGIVFTSEKSSRVLQLDMTNGHVRDLSRPRPNRFPISNPGSNNLPSTMPTITLEMNRCEIPFYLSRVDYSVSGVDMTTGEVFQMSYSDIEPLQKTHSTISSAERNRNRLQMTASASAAAGNQLSGGSNARNALVSNNQDIDFIDLDALDDPLGVMAEQPEELDLHPELLSSPNGEIYFADSDGKYLSHLPTLNLGSLVKSAYVIENSGVGRAVDPDDVRPATPSYIRKLNVVRRMNRGVAAASEDGALDIGGVDLTKRSEGTVLVQPIHNEGGGVSGVFAIEIPPSCRDVEDCLQDVLDDSAIRPSSNADNALYLCPSVGSGTAGSKNGDNYCLPGLLGGSGVSAEVVSADGDDLVDDDHYLEDEEEIMARAIASQSLLDMMPSEPPALPHISASPLLDSMDGKLPLGNGSLPTVQVIRPRRFGRPSKQSETESMELNSVIEEPSLSSATTARNQAVCKQYCECEVREALDLFSTSPAGDCVDLDSCCDSVSGRGETDATRHEDMGTVALNDSTASAVTDQSTLTVASTGATKSPGMDITGEHKLLRDKYEGKIFGPAAARPGVEEVPGPEPVLGAVTSRKGGRASLLRSLMEFVHGNQWALTFLLIIVVSIAAAVGPNNVEAARLWDHYFGTKFAQTPEQIVTDMQFSHNRTEKPVLPPVVHVKPVSSADRVANLKPATEGAAPIMAAESSSVVASLNRVESQLELDEAGRRVTKIGSLHVYSEIVLGYGSHGTVVFQGGLNGRPVAVKRMLSQFHKSADREISLLIRSDGHPNVVRYFLKEQKSDFLYLALQLCQMSLRDFVVRLRSNIAARDAAQKNAAAAGTAGESGEVSSAGRVGSDSSIVSDALRRSLLQIAQGVTHLHSHRIVHRDIKPHNILCAHITEADHSSNEAPAASALQSLDQLGEYVLKISDMGLSKQLDRNETSFSSMSFSMSMSINMQQQQAQKRRTSSDADGHSSSSGKHNNQNDDVHNSPVGTIGWQAPELLGSRRTAQTKVVVAEPASGSSSQFVTSSVSMSRQVTGDLDEGEEADGEEDEGNATDNDELTTTNLTSDAAIGAINESTGSIKSSVSGSSSKPPPAAQTVLTSRQNRKRTQTVDIFSLGCVFYYVLSVGEHPFGEWFERESNIISSNVMLPALENHPDAADLIRWMLNADPLKRPTGSEVCSHPFFWSSNKRLEFLVEFSDRLEQEPATAPVVLAVESNANWVVGSRWDSKLDSNLLEDMGKYRKYDANSVRDLLRVIRNKRHHYHELSPAIKKVVGALPMGFYTYFDKRFPRLLLHCVKVAERFLAADRLFAQWFQKPKRITRANSNTNLAVTASAGPATTSGSSTTTPAVPSQVNPAMSEAAVTSIDTSTVPVEQSQVVAGEEHVVSGEENAVTAPPLDVGADVIIWQGSVLETSMQCHGWWRSSSSWVEGGASALSGSSKKQRPNHITKSLQDPKYRTSLCSHWEETAAAGCPMRKKGKCIFAHGPLELRVKDTRRKWNSNKSNNANVSPADLLRLSGGEDVFGAARGLDRMKNRADATMPPINTAKDNGDVSFASRQQQPPFSNPYARPVDTFAGSADSHSVHSPLPPQPINVPTSGSGAYFPDPRSPAHISGYVPRTNPPQQPQYSPYQQHHQAYAGQQFASQYQQSPHQQAMPGMLNPSAANRYAQQQQHNLQHLQHTQHHSPIHHQQSYPGMYANQQQQHMSQQYGDYSEEEQYYYLHQQQQQFNNFK